MARCMISTSHSFLKHFLPFLFCTTVPLLRTPVPLSTRLSGRIAAHAVRRHALQHVCVACRGSLLVQVSHKQHDQSSHHRDLQKQVTSDDPLTPPS